MYGHFDALISGQGILARSDGDRMDDVLSIPPSPLTSTEAYSSDTVLFDWPLGLAEGCHRLASPHR